MDRVRLKQTNYKIFQAVITHNYVLENYVNYDKNKAVIITKANYVYSDYELKK